MICPACRRELDFSGLKETIILTHRLWHHISCEVSEELAKEVSDKLEEVRLLSPGVFK